MISRGIFALTKPGDPEFQTFQAEPAASCHPSAGLHIITMGSEVALESVPLFRAWDRSQRGHDYTHPQFFFARWDYGM